jgi:hypothetical protein
MEILRFCCPLVNTPHLNPQLHCKHSLSILALIVHVLCYLYRLGADLQETPACITSSNVL